MCFAIIKPIICELTFSYPHKAFLIPYPPCTRTKYNPLRSKFNPRPPRTRTQTVRVPTPAPEIRVSQPARVNPPRAGLYQLKIMFGTRSMAIYVVDLGVMFPIPKVIRGLCFYFVND